MDDFLHSSTSVETWSVLLASDDSDMSLPHELQRAGVQVSAHWSINDVVERRETPLFVDVLIVDIRQAGETVPENVVAGAREIADERGVPVVALVDAAQIDLAAVALLDRPHQILCDPSVAEILVALMNARTSPSSLGGVADESERLRQLNSEVARIAETLARLARNDTELSRATPIARDRPLGFGMPPIEGSAPVDARDVRNLIRARRMRDNHFAAVLFADPAWDMLLDLYAAELEHRRVSVSSLCIAAAVPGTTALRWIGTMVDVGLFERQADPFDRRRAYIILTQRAREATAAYFDAVRKAGLTSG